MQAPWASRGPSPHPGHDQCRRGRLKADPPAHSHGLQPAVWLRAATHGPLSRRSVGEKNRAGRLGRGHSRGSPATQSGAHSSALPPSGARAPCPRPVTANAPRLPQALEGSSPAPSPYRELFLLLGSTPLKVVVVVMAPRGEVGWRRENAEGTGNDRRRLLRGVDQPRSLSLCRRGSPWRLFL